MDICDDEPTVRQKTGQLLVQRMMAEIAEELNQYRTNDETLARIEKFINRVELQFGGVEYLVDDYDENQVYSSTATFANAVEVEKSATEFVWAMKFSDFAPIPLSKMTSGRLIVANQTLSLFGVHQSGFANLRTNSRNEITFTFSGTDEVSVLSGIILGLNEADRELITDGSIGTNELFEYIFYGEHLNSPEAVFLPKKIMDPTESIVQSILKNHKLLLNTKLPLEPSESINQCAEDIAFRHLVLKAIGTEQDLMKAQENCDLRNKCTALFYTKAYIDHILISSSERGKNYLAKLSDGYSIKNEQGIGRWVVPLKVTIPSVSSLYLSISNIFARWRPDLDFGISLVDRDETNARIEFFFYPDTILRGYVSLDRFDTNANVFQQHVRDAVKDGRVDIDLYEISFSWSSIVETLVAVGVET